MAFINALSNMAGLIWRPRGTFQRINEQPVSLAPLWLDTLIIMIASSINVLVMKSRGANVLASIADYPEFAERVEDLKTLVDTDVLQLSLSFIVGPIISIAFIGLIMYLVGKITKNDAGLKQTIVLASYAWTPMVLVSLLTTLLVIVLPAQQTLLTGSFFEMLLPASTAGLINVLNVADPFYIWCIALLAVGASVLFKKKGPMWYLIVFAAFGLPIALGVINFL